MKKNPLEFIDMAARVKNIQVMGKSELENKRQDMFIPKMKKPGAAEPNSISGKRNADTKKKF